MLLTIKHILARKKDVLTLLYGLKGVQVAFVLL